MELHSFQVVLTIPMVTMVNPKKLVTRLNDRLRHSAALEALATDKVEAMEVHMLPWDRHLSVADVIIWLLLLLASLAAI